MVKVWVFPKNLIGLQSMSIMDFGISVVLIMYIIPFEPQVAPRVLHCCLCRHQCPDLLFWAIHLFDMRPSTQKAGPRAPEEHCPCRMRWDSSLPCGPLYWRVFRAVKMHCEKLTNESYWQQVNCGSKDFKSDAGPMEALGTSAASK